MQVYLDLALILNFTVDFLLLLATNRLAGFPPSVAACALASALGAVYAGACFLPGFGFLGNTLWRTVSLSLMSGIAFGWNRTALRRGVLFVLLSMALGGIALGLGKKGFAGIVASAGGLALLCLLGFHGKVGASRFVPVELCYGGKSLRLTALRDTGNTLCDPVTGQQVLVTGAEVAQELTGLTKAQLRDPVATLCASPIPGLRLIPYKAVGNDRGMLLALRFPAVKVGSWQGSSLVAFTPEGLERNGAYQVLTGGTL